MSSSLNQFSPAFTQIEKIVETIPGWTPIDQLYTLYSLVRFTETLEGDVLEIGSWCGRSTVILGLAAASAVQTTVHAVDLFPAKSDWSENSDGSYSFKVKIDSKTLKGYHEQTVWKEPYMRDIAPLYVKYDSVYDIFNESLVKANVQDIVKSHRGDSSIIPSIPISKVRLAFIDADHSYEAVCQDIKYVESLLISGGYICFDDAFSHYEGVNKAIQDCIIDSGKYESCQQMTRKLFVARLK